MAVSKVPYHINTHTHIFTYKHVPKRFTRKMKPVIISWLNLSQVIWFYRTFNPRYNHQFSNFSRFVKSTWYKLMHLLGYVWLDKLIYLVLGVVRWVFSVVLGLLRMDQFFSEESKMTLDRIKDFARISNYADQSAIFNKLKKYYNTHDKLVLLPMDMGCMGAGQPIQTYEDQIKELVTIKKNHPDKALPFAFIDPRIDYTGKSFEPRQLIEEHDFQGFKIYPALGYFPFDKDLLDYYQYANDKGIPIISHCSKGPVYYRGRKKEEWRFHEILNKFGKEKEGKGLGGRLELKGIENQFFTAHFGHPLNYHCLLDPTLLSLYLKKNHIDKEYDFSQLKICLAHMGGASEIKKYFAQLYTDYEKAIGYDEGKSTLDHHNRHQIWYNASWFKIIVDLMKAYPQNIYSDISYTLGEYDLLPFFKDLIRQNDLHHQLLFGTDFYMVSQEKSEKEIVHIYRGGLGEELFDQIAFHNAETFLCHYN